ncbi:glycosyltransferase family 2 protein [Romboutsia ilealis]|uniref:glycosyltransferase family 2 protein n=1 Tax=Romboutsia ilealis TaxID=1115758 RepID=UPI0025A5954B|nr:glycosyltransferase family A protein [Romboutsia ilealis]
MPRFSIIIPVYNIQNYLENCLDKILNQSFNDYEIILINDGSTDDSGLICEKYKLKDNRIKYINKSNEGPSSARNDGIKIATGEYVVFVDGDDWLFENSLEKINELINENKNPDIIVNRTTSYYTEQDEYIDCSYYFELEKMSKLENQEVFNVCQNMHNFWMAPWVFIVNTEHLKKNNLYFSEGLLHEDEEWVPRLILNSKNIAYNNFCYYCNRANRPGSITQSLNIKKEFDKLEIIDILINESKDPKYNQKQKEILLGRCSNLYMGVVGKFQLYVYDNKNYRKLKQLLKDKKHVLLYSKKNTHKIVYIISSVIGIEATSKIMNSFWRK